MKFIEYNYLNIIQTESECDFMAYETLISKLKAHAAFSIYLECKGRVYGAIYSNSLLKLPLNQEGAEADRSIILRVPYGISYYEALEMFDKDSKVNEIPVIDETGHLLGVYQRWDDLLYLKYNDFLQDNVYAEDFFALNKKIAMVRPGKDSDYKNWLYEKYLERIKRFGCEIYEINNDEIAAYQDRVNYVLTVCEDEGWGCGALYSILEQNKYNWAKMPTLRRLEEKIKNHAIGSSIESILNYLAKKGVHVLIMYYKDTGSQYGTELRRQIDDKYKRLGVKKQDVLYPEWYKSFFADLYSEDYEEHVRRIRKDWFPLVKTSRMHILKDMSTPVFNVVCGKRVTVGQPEEYRKRIFVYGTCFVMGYYVDDSHTISSLLQKYVSENHDECIVYNEGCLDSVFGELNRITDTDMRPGDIAVIYIDNRIFESLPCLNLMEVLEKENASYEWMTDSGLHPNHLIMEMYSKKIYSTIRDMGWLSKDDFNDNMIQGMDPMIDMYIRQYFFQQDFSSYEKVGAIVMNCNPFTKGHRYLIETAAGQMDLLIIFVVEENRSLFSFDFRISAVKCAVADIENVVVVPSGQFILSEATFPEYFAKVVDENLVDNTENDIRIFAEKIAPKLNIRYRFVGEEKNDVVTDQYNNAMKKILPEYGIELVEIKRKAISDETVSASKVREYMKDADIQGLRKLLPNTTIEILDFDKV